MTPPRANRQGLTFRVLASVARHLWGAGEGPSTQEAVMTRLQHRALLQLTLLGILVCLAPPALAICPYDTNCLNNPYGAGSPYKPDGLMNPHSRFGNPYSNQSWTNPYATDPPRIYDREGNYRGRLSANPYLPDSTSNPFGRYGNPYSPDSINNPYGAGNPYNPNPLYVFPSR